MGKYTWRMALVNPFDIGCFESWLSDQSAKGLLFSGAKKQGLGRLGFLQFQKGPPERRRYRMEPKWVEADWPPIEEQRLYEDMGWRFVGSVENQFWVFEAPDRAEIPELHTDPAALGELYEKLSLKPNPLFLLLAYIPAYLLILVGLLWASRNPTLEFLTGTAFYQAGLLLFLVLNNLVFVLHKQAPLQKLKKQLAQNVDIDHHAPYRRTARAFAAQNAAVLGFGVLLLAMQIYGMTTMEVRAYSPADPLPIPALSEIEGGGFRYEPTEWHDDWPSNNRVNSQWSFLTPEQYEIWQTGTVDGSECYMDAEYYRLRFRLFAKPLYESIIAQYLTDDFYRHDGMQIRNLQGAEGEGFDEAVLLTIGDMERLIARRGGSVLEVHYSGTQPTETIAPFFAAALNTV